MFEYCDKCRKREKLYYECEFKNCVETALGKNLYHIECPDQKYHGNSHPDLLFVDNDMNNYEIEIKSIISGLEGRKNVAHDKYINKIVNDLTEVIDSCYALQVNIKFTALLTDATYKERIKKELIPSIENTDFDVDIFPISYSNDICTISLDHMDVKFSKDEHLMFAISNPFVKAEMSIPNPSLSEIQDTIFNTEKIVEQINDYIRSEKVKKKFKSDGSKKILLFLIKYSMLFESMIIVYNEINSDTYNILMKSIMNGVIKDDFYNRIIIDIENVEAGGYFQAQIDCSE